MNNLSPEDEDNLFYILIHYPPTSWPGKFAMALWARITKRKGSWSVISPKNGGITMTTPSVKPKGKRDPSHQNNENKRK